MLRITKCSLNETISWNKFINCKLGLFNIPRYWLAGSKDYNFTNKLSVVKDMNNIKLCFFFLFVLHKGDTWDTVHSERNLWGCERILRIDCTSWSSNIMQLVIL